jgi:hypothetical protein
MTYDNNIKKIEDAILDYGLSAQNVMNFRRTNLKQIA